MKILALEFSSGQRSVAVLHAGPKGVASQAEVVQTGNAGLMSMIEQALRETGLEREQIECIALGLGPGSYTGIRASIASAQGWQLTRDVKLLGIGSDEVLAEQARTDGLKGRVAIVIDAQRNEFYLETFEITAQTCERIEPLRLASLAEVEAAEKSGLLLVGPEIERHFPNGRVLFPRAATLAMMALNRRDFVAGERLEPIYLRQTSFVKAPKPRVTF